MAFDASCHASGVAGFCFPLNVSVPKPPCYTLLRQDYFEAVAILSMSAPDPLSLGELMVIVSLLFSARGGRKASRVDARLGSYEGFTPEVPKSCSV